jgi:hypothetical protein
MPLNLVQVVRRGRREGGEWRREGSEEGRRG